MKGELAAILTRTANNGQASSIWKSYGSCLKGISKIEIELGMKLRASITETMVLTVLAILINRGLKSSTMRGYICAMIKDHMNRGYGTEVFKKDNLSKAILRGKSNMALSSKEEKAERMVDLIRKLKANIQKLNMDSEEKRMIWCGIYPNVTVN